MSNQQQGKGEGGGGRRWSGHLGDSPLSSTGGDWEAGKSGAAFPSVDDLDPRVFAISDAPNAMGCMRRFQEQK